MQATRERILNILKERGQATVDDLSQELGLTTVTVRHHLDILQEEGLVAPPVARSRQSPGRPQYVYTLTREAGAFFPKRYAHLANQLLSEMRARFSPPEVEQMMKRIGERIADQAKLPDGGNFEARLAAAVEFLDDLGYMPQWEPNHDQGYLLHVANCPYELVALQRQEVCAMDLALLTRLLGVTPQRAKWAVRGDYRCTYVLHPPGE